MQPDRWERSWQDVAGVLGGYGTYLFKVAGPCLIALIAILVWLRWYSRFAGWRRTVRLELCEFCGYRRGGSDHVSACPECAEAPRDAPCPRWWDVAAGGAACLMLLEPVGSVAVGGRLACVALPVWLGLGAIMGWVWHRFALAARHAYAQGAAAMLLGSVGMMVVSGYYVWKCRALWRGDRDYEMGPGLDTLRDSLVEAPAAAMLALTLPLAVVSGFWWRARRRNLE